MLRWIAILALMGSAALLAGCSSQDFATPMGGITDVVDSGRDYVPKDDKAEVRARQLANALLAWQHQRGLISEDYFVGSDDVLLVTIHDLEKPGEPSTLKLTVTQDGMISLPLVGPTPVNGLTARQIETKAAKLYSGEYLQEPRISVEVADYRSAPVVVTGAVGKPGIYYLKHNSSTVLDMLSLAEGLSRSAGQQLLIVRNRSTNALPAKIEGAPAGDPVATAADEETLDYDFAHYPDASKGVVAADAADAGPPADIAIATNSLAPSASSRKRRFRLFGRGADAGAVTNAPAVTNALADAVAVTDAEGTPPLAQAEDADLASSAGTEMISVDLKRLLDRGDIQLNVTILGGDIITIPARQSRQVYVLGYVQRAGAFEIETGHDTIAALQAVALAGGLGSAARAQNSFLIRESNKRREVIKVDLTKIARGTRPPVFMEPGDTLVVGSSFMGKISEFIKPSVSAGASFSPVP